MKVKVKEEKYGTCVIELETFESLSVFFSEF